MKSKLQQSIEKFYSYILANEPPETAVGTITDYTVILENKNIDYRHFELMNFHDHNQYEC